MYSKPPPIGFEALMDDRQMPFIGFEQHEYGFGSTVIPPYPTGHTMPSPNQTLNKSDFSLHSPRSMGQMDPSFLYASQPHGNSVGLMKKTLSREELYAIFDEITTIWFQEEWLSFDEQQRKTFLTLQSSTTELLTVQMAIDQFHLTSGDNSLLFEPECLLVRSKAKSKSIFLPNSTLSLENLADVDDTDELHPYHLLAIICHSAETNSKLMFYKHARTNTWYIYYDQSIVSSPHSNLLNADDQRQLESFIVQENSSNPLHLSPFTYLPLSALYNHPIVYVYLPERKKKKRKN